MKLKQLRKIIPDFVTVRIWTIDTSTGKSGTLFCGEYGDMPNTWDNYKIDILQGTNSSYDIPTALFISVYE